MADNQPAAGDAVADATAAVSKLHLDEVTGEMISKTELKKRQKAREKEAAKKEKEAANKDKKPAQAAGNKNAEAAEKELTPNQVCGCAAGFTGPILGFTMLTCDDSTLRFDQEPSTSSMPRARLTLTRCAPNNTERMAKRARLLIRFIVPRHIRHPQVR